MDAADHVDEVARGIHFWRKHPLGQARAASRDRACFCILGFGRKQLYFGGNHTGYWRPHYDLMAGAIIRFFSSVKNFSENWKMGLITNV